MRRFLLPIFLLASIFPLFYLPAHANGGAAFKGELIDSSRAVNNVTGNCVCEANWYTFAMNRGTMTVTAVLKGYGLRFSSVYSLQVALFAGTPRHQVGGAQAACLTKKRVCNRPARIRRRVRVPTVFYLEIYGPGAEQVRYALSVHGNTRVLRCRLRCY